MKWLLFLLGPLAWAVPPLLVTAVERQGLPPYEGTERAYRLEGTGCQTLRVGETLVLQRQGEVRPLGRLEILSVHQDHALAKLALAGETFPLKGDLAVRTELFQALPGMPAVSLAPLPAAEALRPKAIARSLPRSFGPGEVRREPIFFLKGDASLSPGALAKLRAWVEIWGPSGQWSLECPPASLTDQRAGALRAELQRLGVPSLELQPLPEEPPGRYDAIYVKKEPW
jgi:hypothetical protein